MLLDQLERVLVVEAEDVVEVDLVLLEQLEDVLVEAEDVVEEDLVVLLDGLEPVLAVEAEDVVEEDLVVLLDGLEPYSQ